MVSLLPATATVIGIVVLAQIPSARQIVGVGLVVAAVAIHRERTTAAAAPHPHRRTAADMARDSHAATG
jgi:inner membrane transporter RhtA